VLLNFVVEFSGLSRRIRLSDCIEFTGRKISVGHYTAITPLETPVFISGQKH
jgi:hypothetical protein